MDAELRRKIASLLVVRASGHLLDEQRGYPRWELDNATLRRLLAEGVGGVILLGGCTAELALRTQQLRGWSDGSLLLCADVEEGVGQRFAGASWLVPPLALGRLHRHDPATALRLTERYGRCTGREARDLGLNWVLGPVCDVNNNPANPVINVRAWGEDPASAGALAAAFSRGAQSQGVLCCAKHFPGHGDTSSDSHLELPLLSHDRARLEAIELPPFRAAIASGVASVMTAHLLLPALDPLRPATLSAAVLKDLLRRDLGFDGLVVTDALVMEAIAGRYGAGEAAVLALEAGADLVLMPADADGALDAIEAAVVAGRLGLKDLEASLRRRQTALARCNTVEAAGESGVRGGPDQPLAVALAALSAGPSQEDRALALELVEGSLERQGGRLSPTAAGGINLLRLDTLLGNPLLPASAPALTLPALQGYAPLLLEARCPPIWRRLEGVIDPEQPLELERLGAGPVLLQLFVRGNPFVGGAAGMEPWPAAILQLQAAQRLAGLAVYGSPYLWESLRPLLDPGVPAAWSPGQMPLAQAVLLRQLGCGAAAASGGFTD
ncbi:MAG: glycoside hydrolase family 3 N-terminal domain-containing protein [Synechococcaceae cyanobacterium]